MTSKSNDVEVRIGGKRYGGWKSVLISSGIDQIARAFVLEVTETFPGKMDVSAFRTGDLVQVYIGDDLVCTGYITSAPIKYDGKSVTVQIQGKSRTVDLVDCCPPSAAYAAPATNSDTWKGVKGKSGAEMRTTTSATPQTSWKSLPAGRIIEELAKPYGITLSASDYGNQVKTHTVNPGETVLDSIKRLITKDGLVLMDDEAGNLVLTDPGAAGKATDALELGVNVLKAEAKFDASKRFSNYVVLGQHAGTDTDFGRSAAEDKGVARDENVGRFRLKVLKDGGQGSRKSAQEQAEFEARYQKAQYEKTTYTVQGWRQSDGSLWKTNVTVTVTDAMLAKKSREMLVVGVNLSLSSAGQTAELVVMPPSGYKREGAHEEATKSSDQWAGVK